MDKDIRGLIYDSCYDDAIEKMEEMYEVMPESLQQFMKQHDDIMLFLALRDVFHLLDLMELDDREKLEFRKLTKTGEIQIEAAEKTYKRIRHYLLDQMKRLADEVTEIGDIDFSNTNFTDISRRDNERQ